MNKLFAIILFSVAVSNLSLAYSAEHLYKIDEVALEAAFTTSEDLTFQMSGALFSQLANPEQVSGDDNKQLVAGLVALGSILLGVGVAIPVHRFILGTDGKTLKIFCSYFCTISGCGVILLVDGILLLLDSEGDKYINNSKFIMWM